MRIEIGRDAVTVVLTRWDRFLCARCVDLTIPFDAIRGVRVRPEEASTTCKGLRVGTDIPGYFVAGTFYHLHEPPDFYYMKHAERTLALDLASPPALFQKVILDVGPDAAVEDVAAAIEQAVEKHLEAVQEVVAGPGGGGGGKAAALGGEGLQEPLLSG